MARKYHLFAICALPLLFIGAAFAQTTQTPEALGLNKTEADSWEVVRDYFSTDDSRAMAFDSLIENKDDFRAAYRRLLPHYGDGTMQQMAGLGGIAVAQHMTLVRAGIGRRGDSWAQQFGNYTERERTTHNHAIVGTGYGVSFGYDLPDVGLDVLGVFAQLVYTGVDEKNGQTNEARNEEVRSENFLGGIYAVEDFGFLQMELTAQRGRGNLSQNRWVSFGQLDDNMPDDNILTSILTSSWDASMVGGSAKFLIPAKYGRHFWQGTLGVDYFEMEQDAYSERGLSDNASLRLKLGQATSALTTTSFGIRGGMQFGDDDAVKITWRPHYYLGVKVIDKYEPYAAQVQFAGDDSGKSFLLKNYDEPEDSTVIGFGVLMTNNYFALELRYSGSLGDNSESHEGGIAARLRF